MESFLPVNVDQPIVECDGGGNQTGHPLVYLNLGDAGQIDCPYCGRSFVMAHGTTAES